MESDRKRRDEQAVLQMLNSGRAERPERVFKGQADEKKGLFGCSAPDEAFIKA